jgi:hypothetical protein
MFFYSLSSNKTDKGDINRIICYLRITTRSRNENNDLGILHIY